MIDPDKTMPETPLAKIIADTLRPEFERMQGEISAKIINALSPRLAKLEVGQRIQEHQTGGLSAEVTELKRRIAEIEHRYRTRDTVPAPSSPPESGA